MNSSLLFSCQLLLTSLFILSASSASATHHDEFYMHRFPGLGLRGWLHRIRNMSEPSKLPDDYVTSYYNQTVDHFNYRPQSYTTFKQKYVINNKFWGGPPAPIFVYFGAESALDNYYIVNGFIKDNAQHFNALQVYIEHRYYGESVPFGSIEEVMNDPEKRGYFNSAQALTDYAEIILQVRNDYGAHKSPVIIVGGSYGGMLAAWFRLKFPHMATGALASSAPVLFFDDQIPHDGYFAFVTKEFKNVSETCYQTIRSSWAEINKVADEADGLQKLSEKFKTCSKLESHWELKNYLSKLYTYAAQYNTPPLPPEVDSPLERLCRAIDGGGSDTLDRIFAGVVSYAGTTGDDCYINQRPQYKTSVPLSGWQWQSCSEMVMPFEQGPDTMFEPGPPFNLSEYVQSCNNTYGVPSRPNWVPLYYGLYDIKLVLKNFGSNIIFSNGLKDPYSIGGVLESISDSLLAVHTPNGSHCLDIDGSRNGDPDWLVNQRNTIVMIIDAWIAKYYEDLAVSAFTDHVFGKKIAFKTRKISNGGFAQKK